MKKQYVICDWDGCLAKTMQALLAAFKVELVRQGMFFTDDQIIKYMFGNWLEGLKYWGIEDPEKTVIAIKRELEMMPVIITLGTGVTKGVDPRILIQAMEILGTKKEKVVWMGNSANDVEMGQAAGVDTVLFHPAENEKFSKVKTFSQMKNLKVITEFKELLEVV